MMLKNVLHEPIHFLVCKNNNCNRRTTYLCRIYCGCSIKQMNNIANSTYS